MRKIILTLIPLLLATPVMAQTTQQSVQQQVDGSVATVGSIMSGFRALFLQQQQEIDSLQAQLNAAHAAPVAHPVPVPAAPAKK